MAWERARRKVSQGTTCVGPPSLRANLDGQIAILFPVSKGPCRLANVTESAPKAAPKIPLDRHWLSVILSYDTELRMVLQINFKSGMPIYLQIVDQIKAAAASGALRPGEALPSIRPLSEELRVNRNTVAKAYSELESLGVVEAQPGRGCFLKKNQSALRKEVRRKLLIEEVDQAIVQAHHLQVPRDEFLKLIHERMDVLDDKRRAHEDHQED